MQNATSAANLPATRFIGFDDSGALRRACLNRAAALEASRSRALAVAAAANSGRRAGGRRDQRLHRPRRPTGEAEAGRGGNSRRHQGSRPRSAAVAGACAPVPWLRAGWLRSHCCAGASVVDRRLSVLIAPASGSPNGATRRNRRKRRPPPPTTRSGSALRRCAVQRARAPPCRCPAPYCRTYGRTRVALGPAAGVRPEIGDRRRRRQWSGVCAESCRCLGTLWPSFGTPGNGLIQRRSIDRWAPRFRDFLSSARPQAFARPRPESRNVSCNRSLRHRTANGVRRRGWRRSRQRLALRVIAQSCLALSRPRLARCAGVSAGAARRGRGGPLPLGSEARSRRALDP